MKSSVRFRSGKGFKRRTSVLPQVDPNDDKMSINSAHQVLSHHTHGHGNAHTNPFGEFRKIVLKEDMYALAFVCSMNSVKKAQRLKPQVQGRNMFAVLWIFFIEVSIIVIIIKTVVLDDPHFEIQTLNVDVFITRFVCTILMHMELIEDVKQGLNLL